MSEINAESFAEFSKELDKNLSQLFSETQEYYDSRRVFHGRGKAFLPIDWCAVDYFDGVILATIYWLEDEVLEPLFIEALSAQLSTFIQSKNIHTVLLQRRDLPGVPYRELLGTMPESAFARRGALKFRINFNQQNTGYFLDIESARTWLESRCENARVLNLFSYTCTFSIIAQAAGAQSVVNIDLSKKSLARGRENHHLNHLPTDNIHFFGHDIFKSWGKLKRCGPYDIVIIDPPSFQKGSFIASKDYKKVLAKMNALVDAGGVFLACLNAPEITQKEFKALIDDTCHEFEYVETLDAGEMFPETEEGRGLKMLVYQK